ncbi:MAG: hypothetical protein AB8G22_16790 [Saprospiraceae bacterium]
MKISLLNVIPANRIWFSLILMFFIFNIANAQNTTKQATLERAENAIRTLSDGILVVRLQSNQKKIKALEDLVENKKMSARNLKNLNRELEETKINTKEKNSLLMKSFADNYNFSDVLFMYDYDTEKLLTAEQEGYFLGKDLIVDAKLSLNDNNFLTLRFGTTDLATTSGVEGMIITDQELKDLDIPFPYAYKEGGFMYVFDKLFDGKNAAGRNYPRIIARMNKKLKKYYNEVE